MRIRVRVIIEASVPEVWDAIKSIESHVDWMADAESIVFTTARTSGVGTSFVCITKVGPLRLRDAMTVTEWSPRKAMGIEHQGLVGGKGRFTLKAVRLRSSESTPSTRFVWKERLTFPWWMGGPVGALCAKPVLRWIWKRNLGRLKRLIESGSL